MAGFGEYCHIFPQNQPNSENFLLVLVSIGSVSDRANKTGYNRSKDLVGFGGFSRRKFTVFMYIKMVLVHPYTHFSSPSHEFICSSAIFLASSQNQNQYYQHQNYVKKKTKTIKTISKSIPKPLKSISKPQKPYQNQNSRPKFQNKYRISCIPSLHRFRFIS